MTPVATVCIILYFQDNDDVQHNKKSPRKVTKQFFNLLSQQLFPSHSTHALTHIEGEGSRAQKRDKLPTALLASYNKSDGIQEGQNHNSSSDLIARVLRIPHEVLSIQCLIIEVTLFSAITESV